LAAFAGQVGINYKLLKYFNPWLRTDALINPEGKKYMLKIPHKNVTNYDALLRMADAEMAPAAIPVSDTLSE
jgi:hypothetical protein